jgi:hypothetical protein
MLKVFIAIAARGPEWRGLIRNMMQMAVTGCTKEAAAAKAFIDFLQTGEAAAVLKAKGNACSGAAGATSPSSVSRRRKPESIRTPG